MFHCLFNFFFLSHFLICIRINWTESGALYGLTNQKCYKSKYFGTIEKFPISVYSIQAFCMHVCVRFSGFYGFFSLCWRKFLLERENHRQKEIFRGERAFFRRTFSQSKLLIENLIFAVIRMRSKIFLNR